MAAEKPKIFNDIILNYAITSKILNINLYNIITRKYDTFT